MIQAAHFPLGKTILTQQVNDLKAAYRKLWWTNIFLA